MKHLTFLIILLIPISLFAQLRMKRIAFLETGLEGSPSGNVVCGDFNHNGKNEMIFKTYLLYQSPSWYYEAWQIWEESIFNKYRLVYCDTGWITNIVPPLGIETGNLHPFVCTLLDQDSAYDLVGGNQENHNVDSVTRALSTVQEGQFATSFPTSLVWFDRLGTWWGSPPVHYITDLDHDGRKEIFVGCGGPRIYENTGNNQYTLVFCLPPGSPGSWGGYAFGDFDQDGRMEIVFPGSLTHVFIREYIGNNQYPVVCSLPFPSGLTNPHDCWDGRDVDNDGKPEFFVAFDVEPTFSLYMWEATSNNTYERAFIDQRSISGTSRRVSRRSKCGDINGDGIEEVIWATHKQLFVYKATGNNQFQQVWTWWQDHGEPGLIVSVYDMNKNGYNEIVVGGGLKTSIFEIEAVRLLTPNGGENYPSNSQATIYWQTFNLPRCDSLSLFYSIDNGNNYTMITHGLSGDDTSYIWTVPNLNSDSCKIKIIAYGPGWQYDESDGVFRISSVGIEENPVLQVSRFTLQVYPNPTKLQTTICYSLSTQCKTSILLFDIAGKLVKALVDETKKPGNYSITLNSRTLSSGVYFLSLQTQDKRTIERLVVIK